MKIARVIVLMLPFFVSGCGDPKVFYVCASAEDFVRRHILSPDTAKFSECNASTAIQQADGTWDVDGDVAYDGWGLTINAHYAVVIRHDDELDIDRLVSLSFDGKPYDLLAN